MFLTSLIYNMENVILLKFVTFQKTNGHSREKYKGKSIKSKNTSLISQKNGKSNKEWEENTNLNKSEKLYFIFNFSFRVWAQKTHRKYIILFLAIQCIEYIIKVIILSFQ